MRIGIITFHWGASHGGVLQAYSAQKYLQRLGYEVVIIDYVPKCRELTIQKAIKPNYPGKMRTNIANYIKSKRIDKFRNKMALTSRYKTQNELINNPPNVDVFITGSDQVWNPYFLLHGENCESPVYFLSFAPPCAKKIAMSVSFGCTEYSAPANKVAQKYICDFDAVSVREQSGLQIVNNLGYKNAYVTADPTALLLSDDYLKTCNCIKAKNTGIVKYFLHGGLKTDRYLISMLKKELSCNTVTNIVNMEIDRWLASIRDSKVVVTNSYHCLLFCLYFHKPFWVVLENGELAGMNDRILSIVEYFELQSRLLCGTRPISFSCDINWNSIDHKMDAYRDSLVKYIKDKVVASE